MWSSTDIPAFYPDLTRVLRAETRNELRLREQLANDPIAALMRTLECDACGWPVTQCKCAELDGIAARTISTPRWIDVDDCEPLPFSAHEEITG